MYWPIVISLLLIVRANKIFASDVELFNDTLPDIGNELVEDVTFRIDRMYAIGTYAKVNWFTAQQICSARSMTLASLSTAKEAMSLQDFLTENGLQNENFWLAGTNLAQLGNWFWFSDGSPIVSYTNWNLGEPNNAGGNEHCLALMNNGFWNDLTCELNLYFICENRCPLNSYNVPLFKK